MAEHNCPLVAVIGESRYPCRSHAHGHIFAAHWPKCPAPWCRLEPGHRSMHDVPAGKATFTVDVAKLPRRVAQVTHAAMEAWSARTSSGPVTTREICEYDDPGSAPTLRHTLKALHEAAALGLISRAARYWFATDRAWEIRRALEDRVLMPEVAAGG